MAGLDGPETRYDGAGGAEASDTGTYIDMLKPSFSTVCCPEWTLSMVAERARATGFEAVELRTFGDASRRFACDPALTQESKARAIFMDKGIEILSLATSARFDEEIFPPVIGHIFGDHDRCVREAQRAVDLAVGLECPYVRVFAFEHSEREKRASAVARISERLAMVVDHAEKTGVKVVLENGGSFPRAVDLLELLDRVNHPLLGACYSLAAGSLAGDDPRRIVRELGPRLWVARIKDLRAGKPVDLGTGELGCEAFVRELHAASFNGPLVFEWDRAWVPDLAPADEALRTASRAIFTWLNAPGAGAMSQSSRAVGAR